MAKFIGEIISQKRRPIAFNFLMKNFEVDYVEAARFFAGNAAFKYHLPDVGEIKCGNFADIVIVNSNHEIEAVLHRGNRVGAN